MITIEDLIDRTKIKTKLISVDIKGNRIDLPIDYGFDGIIKYVESYEITKNSKKAFCVMLQDMIESRRNFFKENEYIQNITIEDIKTINDEDLKKVGEAMINQSEELISVYRDCKGIIFYDNFYKASKYQYDKIMKEFQTNSKFSIEPCFKQIKSAFEPLKSLYTNNIWSTISDRKSTTNNCKTGLEMLKELYPEKLNVEYVPINKLMKEQTEVNKNIEKTTLENQRENRIANEDAKKLNIKNYKIMVYTLIATIISIILAGISLWVTKHINIIF